MLQRYNDVPSSPAANPQANPQANPLDNLNPAQRDILTKQTDIGQLTPDQILQRYKDFSSSPQWAQDRAMSLFSPAERASLMGYQSFKSQIGRDPTSSEYAQILPAFQQNVTYGNAILGSMKDRLSQNPNDPINQDKSNQYSDQINHAFQSSVGRAATPEELSHFGGLMATGNLDPYGVNQYIQGTPEYQGQQDTKFRGDLTGQLDQADLDYFGRAKQNVISQFMQNGTAGSTALDSALADMMGQIHSQNRQYLAGVTSQQYQGNKDLALGNYQNQLNQFGQNQNYQRQNAQNAMNQFTGRSNEISDYQNQMNNYAKQMGGGSSMPWGQLVGGAIGAGIGGFASQSPAGVNAGYQIGSGFGGGYDRYQNLR